MPNYRAISLCDWILLRWARCLYWQFHNCTSPMEGPVIPAGVILSRCDFKCSTHLVYTNSDRVPSQTRPTYSAWWPVSIFEVLKLRAQLANQPIHSICAFSDTQYWVFQKWTSFHDILSKCTVWCICESKSQDRVATGQNSWINYVTKHGILRSW